jgi:hypothetical protein
MIFQDGSVEYLFQKFNFTWSVTSLFTSFIWSYLSNLSTTFRRAHRSYEKTQHRSVQLVHPHPCSLWENYKTFLITLGHCWKNNDDSMLGPTWVVLTDVTAVAVGVPGKKHDVGSSVYNHLITANHKKTIKKKQLETLGKSLGKTIRAFYEQKVAFIDISLGNCILDAKGAARFIDGELLQQFPEGVPSHYKALELVLFMEYLYFETVRDYGRSIHSVDLELMKTYQHGLLVFASAFLNELGLSRE